MTNTGNTKIGGIFALALATLITPMAAMADAPSPTSYGSAAILTNRNCTATASGDCQVGPTRTFTQYAGGAGSSFSVSASNEANSGAGGSAYSSFGGSAVPTLGVSAFAGQTTRTGASALAYQTYVYTGSAAINLALAGTLHYYGSGDAASSSVPGVEPGGRGFFGANLTVLPVSALDGIGTSGADLIGSLTGLTDCGAGATATAFASSTGLGDGEHSIPLSLTTSCSGGAITILPGQAFVILTTVQAMANMHGYLDATHTFSAFFDPDQTVFTATGEKVGATFLAEAITAAPESATWAQMILGFGVVGLATRRTRPAGARAAV